MLNLLKDQLDPCMGATLTLKLGIAIREDPILNTNITLHLDYLGVQAEVSLQMASPRLGGVRHA